MTICLCPEPTRAEFRRLLKPGGWLVVASNRGTDESVELAMSRLFTPEYGFDPKIASIRPEWKPLIYYYGNGRFQRIRVPFVLREGWERFFGSLLSTSGMPDESNPNFSRMERAARRVFDNFGGNNSIELHGVTEVFLGQVSGVA